MKIGILAVQGAFIEHEKMLSALGVQSVELRRARDLLQSLDGLILPGGESTVMGKLITELDMLDKIKAMIESGLPTLGTCAGLIMLAQDIENDSRRHLGTMALNVVRNGYGRQLGSFKTEGEVKGIGRVPMVFIRAPYIKALGEGVEPLAETGGKIVAARQGRQLVTAFHPELTANTKIHEYFLYKL